MLRDLLLNEQQVRRFNEILEEVKELNSHIPILVEGSKDIEALRTLGIRGEIITINRGMSLVELAEFIRENYGEIILLLDWDSKGKELTHRLETLLWDSGVNTHPEIRKAIQNIVPHISTVEELHL